jgi:GT2 family glycosyltransferase
MSLLAMAVWDTELNGRAELTRRTLASLARTVDWSLHRLFVVDNGSTDPATIELLGHVDAHLPVHYGGVLAFPPATVIRNGENLGTARAINKAWAHRNPGEAAIKLDNDIEFHEEGWADRLEECVARDPQLGIVGLKRDDLWEHPAHENPWFRSELKMLPHQPGQRWLIVEKVHHCIGTVQLYSSSLLDKIGYLYQAGWKYAFDDGFSAVRCKTAGFYSAFYPHCRISHIDPGGGEYTDWKQKVAADQIDEFHRICNDYASGARPVYQGPEDE